MEYATGWIGENGTICYFKNDRPVPLMSLRIQGDRLIAHNFENGSWYNLPKEEIKEKSLINELIVDKILK